MVGQMEEARGDHEKALKAYRLGCDQNIGVSCSNVGSILMAGRVGTADYPQAEKMFARACELRYLAGCRNRAALFADPKRPGGRDMASAAVHFGTACELDDADSCAMAGYMLMIGEDVPQDIEKGRKYLEKGCRLGDGDACKALREIR
jgi:TPR repeat protein